MGASLKSERKTLFFSVRVRRSFPPGHGVVWLLLTVETPGLALLVWPYELVAFVLSRTVVTNSSGREVRRVVTSGFVAYVGHTLLWTLAVLLSFGLAGPFWLYDVFRFVLSHTRMEPVLKGAPS